MQKSNTGKKNYLLLPREVLCPPRLARPPGPLLDLDIVFFTVIGIPRVLLEPPIMVNFLPAAWLVMHSESGGTACQSSPPSAEYRGHCTH